VQLAGKYAAAAVAPVSAAVLLAALLGTLLPSAVPCETAGVHVAAPDADTPTIMYDIHTNHQTAS